MNKILNKVLTSIIKFRFIIISAFLLLIFSLTLIKIQNISNYKSSAVYLEQQAEKQQVRQINIDAALIQQLEALEETPIDVDPNNLGTKNPFQP